MADGSHPWEIPSGGVDTSQDSNIWDTVLRETYEETGIRVDPRLLRPISLGLKNGDYEPSFPDLEMMLSLFGHPQARDSIWLNESAINWGEPQKGGLVFVTMVSEHTIPLSQFLTRRFGHHEILLEPPASVDRSEISRHALVPLDMVVEGTSELIHRSSHLWAHIPGLMSVLTSVEPPPQA